MISVDVQYHGPIMQGHTAPIMTRLTTGAATRVAQAGYNLIRAELGRVLRHPTGYYESQIAVDNAMTNHPKVTDSNVIYGPWLEGVGSRNRTTRFKGYATFRRMAQQLDRQVLDIIQRDVDEAVKELGG